MRLDGSRKYSINLPINTDTTLASLCSQSQLTGQVTSQKLNSNFAVNISKVTNEVFRALKFLSQLLTAELFLVNLQ